MFFFSPLFLATFPVLLIYSNFEMAALKYIRTKYYVRKKQARVFVISLLRVLFPSNIVLFFVSDKRFFFLPAKINTVR